jgi:hypothetical protein
MYSFTEIYEVAGGSSVIIVNTVRYWNPEELETDSQGRQENFLWAKLQDKLWALTQSPTMWDTRGISPVLENKVLKISNQVHPVDPFPYTPITLHGLILK